MKEAFFEHQAQTSPHPIGLEIARAEGVYLFDNQGNKYFDLISGLAVNNIGHRHPEVIAAIKHQLDAYMHVMPYGEFIQQPQMDLALKIKNLLPQDLSTSYFVNSGAEAIEGAMKLAKRYTGRKEIIACNKSYHGSTHGALSVTGNEIKRSAFYPLLENVKFIEFNSQRDISLITDKTAAVIIETVQGDAGVRIPQQGYLKAVKEKCEATGTLLILDEIQCGFGRTGSFFAFEQFNVVPDILCIAKAMGGGMPIGCFVSSKEKMNAFTHDPMLGHITTFGGHPVSCAAAIANISVIENGLLSDVAIKGALIKEMLTHPLVKEIRQIGLMLAIDLPTQDITRQVVEMCLKRGVITFWFLSCPASFRLAPPLTISEKEIAESCQIIHEVFEEVMFINAN